MTYLTTTQMRNVFFDELSKSKTIILISPYMNFSNIIKLLEDKEVGILTRFTFETFRNGSSNIEFFEKLCNLGAKIKSDESLHSKIYIFDDSFILGSSNLTFGGLKNNHESNLHIKNIDIEYDSVRKEILDLYETNGNIISRTVISDYKKRLEHEKVDFKDKYIKKLSINNSENTIIVLPSVLPETSASIFKKAFICNEKFIDISSQIKKELEESNYSYISLESYCRLQKWIYPKSDNSPYKNASEISEEISLLLFGYKIPLEVAEMKIRNYSYLNKHEKRKIIKFHEERIKF